MQKGLPLMWRDRWWRMFDRNPIMQWVYGRVALLGDAAHPPLQYMAQGAIMAIEDGWVLAEHVGAQNAVRTESGQRHRLGRRTRGVRRGAPRALPPGAEHRARLGELWHLDGVKREQRNVLLRSRDTYDYSFTEWIYGPTALTPEQEPPIYTTVPLNSVHIDG